MRPDAHEIYSRRRSRNLGLGLTLGGFVVLVFMVTVVKLTAGHPIQAYDHTYRPALLPEAAE